MRGSSAVANPVHRCAASTTAPASARIANETRESGQSIGHRARVPSAVSPAVFRELRTLQIPPLSPSLPPLLSLPSRPSAPRIPVTYIRTYEVDRSLFLSFSPRHPGLWLELVSVSHGLSVVPALLAHALLVAGSSSPEEETWTLGFSLPESASSVFSVGELVGCA